METKIYLVYAHSSNLGTFLPEVKNEGRYFLVKVFSNNSIIENDLIQKNYSALFENPPPFIGDILGPFEDMEAIKKFAYSLCQAIDANSISIFNLEEFNGILSSASKVGELKDKLNNLGDELKNIDKQGQNILSRIFGDL